VPPESVNALPGRNIPYFARSVYGSAYTKIGLKVKLREAITLADIDFGNLAWVLEISPLWPTSVWTHRPVLTSHTLTVWSNEPVIIFRPVVSKLSETISAVCPSSVCRHSPVTTSHNRAVLSIEPVATVDPCGLKDKQTISVACPRNVW